MSIKDDYYIRPLDYQSIKYYIENYHYLERMGSCSYGYGVYEIEDRKLGELIGVISYGIPASRTLCKGVCGEDERDEVLELTRLWTIDDSPRNLESWFIANTIKDIDYDIIVSYADSNENHIGYVYQATNWLYTGMTSASSYHTVDGQHSRTIGNNYTLKELKEKFGDKVKKLKRSKKHRYVYFNCNKRRKRELMEKLNYPIKEYPKLEKE